eukprot:8453357-Karenia_brevis.AAC.1
MDNEMGGDSLEVISVSSGRPSVEVISSDSEGTGPDGAGIGEDVTQSVSPLSFWLPPEPD